MIAEVFILSGEALQTPYDRLQGRFCSAKYLVYGDEITHRSRKKSVEKYRPMSQENVHTDEEVISSNLLPEQ